MLCSNGSLLLSSSSEFTSPKSAPCERVACHEKPPVIANATLSSPLDGIDLLRYKDQVVVGYAGYAVVGSVLGQLNYTCSDGNAVSGEAGRTTLSVRCAASGDWE